MGKWRKVLILLTLLVFIAGLGILLYPYLQGMAIDHRIKNDAQAFLEKVENQPMMPESNNPHDFDSSGTPPEKSEPVPYPELLEAMENYNHRIWEEKQSCLSDPWAYEQPSFQLSDYGIPDEVFGVITIPRLELEMPICATRS